MEKTRNSALVGRRQKKKFGKGSVWMEGNQRARWLENWGDIGRRVSERRRSDIRQTPVRARVADLGAADWRQGKFHRRGPVEKTGCKFNEKKIGQWERNEIQSNEKLNTPEEKKK